MKAVPKVNTDGLYLEDELVDDAFNGVVPFYAGAEQQPELNPETDLSETVEAEEGQNPEIAGYLVGVPVPGGLFRPRFDLEAWEAYQALKDGTQEQFLDLWVEGLSQEEIDELTKPQPMNPSEMDKIGEQLVQRELEALELKQQNEALGAQIVGLELRVLSMETQSKGDGANV